MNRRSKGLIVTLPALCVLAVCAAASVCGFVFFVVYGPLSPYAVIVERHAREGARTAFLRGNSIAFAYGSWVQLNTTAESLDATRDEWQCDLCENTTDYVGMVCGGMPGYTLVVFECSCGVYFDAHLVAVSPPARVVKRFFVASTLRRLFMDELKVGEIRSGNVSTTAVTPTTDTTRRQ